MIVFRYVCAIISATFASVLAFYFCLLIAMSIRHSFPSHGDGLDHILISTLFIIVGFIGVSVGSICLSRDSRPFGSILLTISEIVIATVIWFLYSSIIPVGPDGPRILTLQIIFLALGGFACAVFYKFRNTAEQDAAANP